MKKIFYLLLLSLSFQLASAQDDPPEGDGKLRDKMIEFIQTKLSLTKDEMDKFQPVFINYLKELRATSRQYRGQGLELQQKVVDLKLRYRDQFKPIIGEKKSNEVFQHEAEFMRTLREELKKRREERRANRIKNSGLSN